MERLNSFWRLKDNLRNDFERSQHWSDELWKSTMAKGVETRKDFNTVLIHQDKKFFVFGTILSDLNIGLMNCGRVQWQKAWKQEKISILY